MNLLVLIGFALFGFWLVNKFIPSGKTDSLDKNRKARQWFEVLELPEDSDHSIIEARYKELKAIYTQEEIAQFEPELKSEAIAYLNEIEAAYHASFFSKRSG